MTLPISQPLLDWKNAETRTSPLITLYEIEIDSETTMRIVEGNPLGGPVTYDGQTYQPAATSRGEVTQNLQGDFGQHSLSISNIDGVAGGYMERYDLEGNTVRVIRVLASTLAVADSLIETYTILNQGYDRKVATVSLGPPNLFKRSVPWRKYHRRCQWDWEGRFSAQNGCAYPSDEFEVDSAGVLTDAPGKANLASPRHGWSTSNLDRASRVDVDITYSGCLYMLSEHANIAGLDAPHVWKILSGDFDAWTQVDFYDARIGSLAGLQCVEGVSPHDSWVSVGRAQDNDGTIFIRSPAALDGVAQDDLAAAGVDAPYVRLARVGDVFTSYYSADGVTWTSLGSRTLAMDPAVRVGLVLSAPDAERSQVSAAFPYIRFLAGGTGSCERTLDYCRGLGNTRRFFGFPGMPRK